MTERAFAKGSIIRFDYPAANYKGARRRLERRCLQVDHVRPLRQEPLAAITIELDPNLDRGEVLVTGKDLEKDAERSFYQDRMENVETVATFDGPVELLICPENELPQVIAEAPTLAAAFAGVREWLTDSLGCIIGLRRVTPK